MTVLVVGDNPFLAVLAALACRSAGTPCALAAMPPCPDRHRAHMSGSASPWPSWILNDVRFRRFVSTELGLSLPSHRGIDAALLDRPGMATAFGSSVGCGLVVRIAAPSQPCRVRGNLFRISCGARADHSPSGAQAHFLGMIETAPVMPHRADPHLNVSCLVLVGRAPDVFGPDGCSDGDPLVFPALRGLCAPQGVRGAVEGAVHDVMTLTRLLPSRLRGRPPLPAEPQSRAYPPVAEKTPTHSDSA